MVVNMPDTPPVIIIGAPRSGTNMLREVLCHLEGFETWPCDEINYIWRHGNRSYANDQFPVALATEKVKKYINQAFDRLRAVTDCRQLIEKTCANSLRIEFINQIFPTARFIYIVRDGLDVAVSASLRRKAKLDPAYLYAKARYVPVTDIPYYAYKYFAARVKKILSKEQSLTVWGPVTDAALPNGVEESSLALSAHQWAECVRASSIALKALGSDRYVTVRYEDFVQTPKNEVIKILNFIGEDVPEDINNVVSKVRKVSVGKGRRQLTTGELSSLQPLMEKPMHALGYHWN